VIRRSVRHDAPSTVPALVVVAVALLVYGNALRAGFVHDDHPQIVENPWLRDARSVPAMFVGSVAGFRAGATANYYRPLMHLTYLGTYRVAGLRPWAFHLVNVLLHAGTSVLVFLLLRDLARPGGPGWLPLAGAVVFAAHPVHTEAVTWIASFPEVSHAFFFLLAFHLHIRWRATSRPRTYALAVAGFALAVLAKEPALGLPVVLVAYDLARGHARRSWRYLTSLLPYALVAIGYLALRFHALGGFSPVRRHPELGAYEVALNAFPLFATYLGTLALPVNLNFFHVLHPVTSLLAWPTLLSLAVAALYAGAVALAVARDRDLLVGLVALAVPIIPVLYLPALGENTFAERYLYLPSFGFVVIVVQLLARLPATRAVWRVAAASLTLLVAWCSWATVQRNHVWKDELTLWSDTVTKSPDSVIARTSLGDALMETGAVDRAIAEYRVALELAPRSATVRNNLGLAYFHAGRLADALREYEQALALDPRSAETLSNLGLVYRRLGLFDKAIESYQRAIVLRPDVPLLYESLAAAHEARGMPDRAEEVRRRARALQRAAR
jgi:tetratricopeptide (TPR) repeat protein